MDQQDLLAPRINIRECPTIKCENCGGIYFKEALYLKWVSRLQGAAQDQPVPFPIYMCMKCDHVNKGFNPLEEEKTTDCDKKDSPLL